MVRQGPRLSSVEVLTILSRACPELTVALSAAEGVVEGMAEWVEAKNFRSPRYTNYS